jgi:hypothetical protein
MKRVFLIAALIVGCGGSTSSELFSGGDASVDDSGTRSDGGDAGGFAACFAASGAILNEMKRCATRADCAVEKHQSDCCGTLLYAGISRGKSPQFALCEERWRASLQLCACPQKPSATEDGQTLDPQANPKVDCVNVQGGLGLCRSAR